jgi:hypothetical protein
VHGVLALTTDRRASHFAATMLSAGAFVRGGARAQFARGAALALRPLLLPARWPSAASPAAGACRARGLAGDSAAGAASRRGAPPPAMSKEDINKLRNIGVRRFAAVASRACAANPLNFFCFFLRPTRGAPPHPLLPAPGVRAH